MHRVKQLAGIAVVLVCVAGCSGLKTASSNGSGNTGGGGGSQAVTVTISPLSTSVAPFSTATFSASVTGTTNTAVTWQVNNVAGGTAKTGVISASGTYSAPYTIDPSLIPANGAASVTVTAVSQASSGSMASATVSLIPQQQNAQSGAVELGTSGGNVNDLSGNHCCGGTLGSLVGRNGSYFILSNNHVLAKSDMGIVGDAISQPGIIDSPSPCTTEGTTTVAHLSEFFNLETGPFPKADAALAQIVNGQVDTSGNIWLLGATQTNGVPDAGAPHAGTGIAA